MSDEETIRDRDKAAEGRALSGDPNDRHLRLGPLIGRGGMAMVFSATQSHLGREVAVKTTPPGASAWARAKLVQEARITGFLEHPGIVPVHDLIEDPDGELKVVLKRIEGQAWSTLIDRPDEIRGRGDQDPLEWHVSVAIAVCRAMQYAHERGVVHRDLKPPNVMIGRFGEVYLLDWGVAGTLAHDPGGLLPCIFDAPLGGTINCMAPEQVASDVTNVGPWTDTFLLGGCLYHAAFGAPPYPGLTLDERKLKGPTAPAFPERDGVPLELRAILEKALAPDRAARFATADALRAALEAFLAHRGARRLAQGASDKAVEARRAWDAGDRLKGEQAAAEAEFGFRAALDLWPEDDVARRQRAALSAERVRFAVTHGETQAASWLLGGLEAPPSTLVHQVDQAVKAEERERERLARIDLDGDRRFGLMARRWMLAVFGLAWLSFWSAIAFRPPATPLPLLLFLVGYGAAGSSITLALRRTMLEQRLNREMMLVQLAITATSVALTLVAFRLPLSVPNLLVLLMLIWSLGMAAIAAIVEPVSLVPSLVWMSACLVSTLWPAALGVCLSVGAAVHGVVPFLVNLTVKDQRPASVAPNPLGGHHSSPGKPGEK